MISSIVHLVKHIVFIITFYKIECIKLLGLSYAATHY